MDKRIVFTRPDGGVSVLIPTPEFVARFDTEEEALAAIIAKDVPPDATNVCTCDASEVPADRTFREAWKRRGKAVEVDMPKAREIHMARIRKARDNHPEWPKIDADRARAVETGDPQLMEAVTARATALRDIPQVYGPQLEAAKTPEELKAIWPKELR